MGRLRRALDQAIDVVAGLERLLRGGASGFVVSAGGVVDAVPEAFEEEVHRKLEAVESKLDAMQAMLELILGTTSRAPTAATNSPTRRPTTKSPTSPSVPTRRPTVRPTLAG